MEMMYCESRTLDDAVEFIHFKEYDKWHVMCPPFLSPVDRQWVFILYRFKDD